MICGALERGMPLAAGPCHSRAGGVNVELNESSTATSGQEAALCGHQTDRQYNILPPFQAFSLRLSRGLPSSILAVYQNVYMHIKNFDYTAVKAINCFFSNVI